MYLPQFVRTRRADMAYLTPEQLVASKKGDMSPCSFAIEIISKNDKADDVQLKLEQYFTDGGLKFVAAMIYAVPYLFCQILRFQ